MARMESELYCEIGDLQIGNLRADEPELRKYIEKASDEIDSYLSKLYVTPLPYSTADSGQLRRTSLILNQICAELASGRAILGMAGSKQDTQVHAYGRWLIERAMNRLSAIESGEIVLDGTGVVPIQETRPAGPLVSNRFESQVDLFYNRQRPPFYNGKNKLAYGAP